jgi:hypothetical protein
LTAFFGLDGHKQKDRAFDRPVTGIELKAAESYGLSFDLPDGSEFL